MAITLGLVEAVDSSGVYVVMPGSRGVVRGPYETLQNVAVGDRVLVVTTDDGENVIVGQAAATSPRSVPATSTDNAVPRFDGTGGALQGSGVTIDDVGSTVIRRAGGDVTLKVQTVTSGNPYLHIAGAADQYVTWSYSDVTKFAIRTTASRWRLHVADDDGSIWSGIGWCFEVERATGIVTVKTLRIGESGPTITSGTGAPSHSAPDGSLYLRTDGTASTTLYVRAAGAWTALS